MRQSRQKGQILIMVMIMIMIIAIITVSVTNNLIKERGNSIQTARFNALQVMAEDLSIQFGMEYGNPTSVNRIEVFNESTFNDFVTNTEFNIVQEGGVNKCTTAVKDGGFNCYQCEIERTKIPAGEENSQLNPESKIKGILSACDAPSIENADVFKDEILVFDLEDADANQTKTGIYTVSILRNSVKPATANIALEVGIDFSYIDSTGQEKISAVKRIMDYNNLFPTAASNAENTRYIPITEDDSDADYKKYIFDMQAVINSIQSNANQGYLSHLLPDGTTINVTKVNQIRLKPYMKSNSAQPGEGRVKIGIETDNTNIQITQGRRIEANIYEESITGQTVGSQAVVVSTIPAIKFPTIFDYVIKTNNVTSN